MLESLLRIIGVYRLYEGWLSGQVRDQPLPEHIGVILDGNRRWGFQQTGEALNGHKLGAQAGENFLEWCLDIGIKTVTIYVFSTENFLRPRHEVDTILGIIEDEARKLVSDERIHKHRVRVKAIGRTDLLPVPLRNILAKIEGETQGYDNHYLNIAVAYGGRAEIVDAAKSIALTVAAGKLSPENIDEELFGKFLYTAHLPNPYPDLIIRTSGEERLSGFLLWQSAYSELIFMDVYWPEIRRIDLLRAIRTYQRRKRRYGR